ARCPRAVGTLARTFDHGTRRAAQPLASNPPRGSSMCRNIKTLFNFAPPTTEDEIRAASLQFVRKVTGFNKPSKVNEAAFAAAVDEISAVCGKLLDSLQTSAPPRDRAEFAFKTRERAALRFSR